MSGQELGLARMKERLKLVDGQLVIKSKTGPRNDHSCARAFESGNDGSENGFVTEHRPEFV